MMVFHRKGRPTFYFQAASRVGYKQLCTHTTDKKLAQRIEHMWSELADKYRAWDLLEPVLTAPRTIGALYDAWTETDKDVEAMRRRAADVDVTPLVDEWCAVYAGTVAPATAAYAKAHARLFFPEGVKRLASSVTTDWLTTTLATHAGGRNTRRKVHSSLTSFFQYLVTVKRVFGSNPMHAVARPALQEQPILFYELDVVERIVHWHEDEARRALYALMYGAAADLSSALTIDKADVLPAEKSVRIRGTKTRTRDRVCRVADWAWPVFWDHAKTQLSGRVFPATWDRWTTSDWHRHAVSTGLKDSHGRIVRAGLNLKPALALRNARHHWAATRMRAGVPVEVVSRQLGHASTQLTLKIYGRFEPKAHDREHAETQTAAYEQRRRTANE